MEVLQAFLAGFHGCLYDRGIFSTLIMNLFNVKTHKIMSIFLPSAGILSTCLVNSQCTLVSLYEVK